MPEGLTVGTGTLEDVFLELTGRELRHERRPSCPSRPRPGAALVTSMVLRAGPDGDPAAAPQRRAAAAGPGDPVLLLIGGAEAGDVLDLGSGRRIDVLTPGVLALAVMSTAFTSLAIATGFERRYGVLEAARRLSAARSGLLVGKVLSWSS